MIKEIHFTIEYSLCLKNITYMTYNLKEMKV